MTNINYTNYVIYQNIYVIYLIYDKRQVIYQEYISTLLVYPRDIPTCVISSRYPIQMTSTKFRYQSRYRLGVVYTCNIRNFVEVICRGCLEDITQLFISLVYTNNLLRYVWYMTCPVFIYQVYDDLYWSYVRYIAIMAFTRRLMLQSRTRPHSPRSASNHIAWSYRDCYSLD